MKTSNIEEYYEIFDRLMEHFPVVEEAIEKRWRVETLEFTDFMAVELDNLYNTIGELKDDIDDVIVKKQRFANEKPNTLDNIIAFVYSSLIKFVSTNKIKGIPMSKNFIDNIKGIT